MRVGPVCVPAGSTMMIPCTGTPVTGEPTGVGVGSVASDVFRVYAIEPCSPVGWGDDLEELFRRTESALTNGEGRAVERVFWSGVPTDGPAGPVYPHLAADTQIDGLGQGAHVPSRQIPATEVTASATDAVEALGELEEYLAECYGGEGIIHVPRRALAHLDHYGVTRREGEQLRTLSGNRVAGYAGGVYPGPDGSEPAAGNAWFYASGMVQVLRGPIENLGRQTGEIVGRDQNTTYYVVYRLYSITFDCCLAAAEVTLAGAVA